MVSLTFRKEGIVYVVHHNPNLWRSLLQPFHPLRISGLVYGGTTAAYGDLHWRRRWIRNLPMHMRDVNRACRLLDSIVTFVNGTKKLCRPFLDE